MDEFIERMIRNISVDEYVTDVSQVEDDTIGVEMIDGSQFFLKVEPA